MTTPSGAGEAAGYRVRSRRKAALRCEPVEATHLDVDIGRRHRVVHRQRRNEPIPGRGIAIWKVVGSVLVAGDEIASVEEPQRETISEISADFARAI